MVKVMESKRSFLYSIGEYVLMGRGGTGLLVEAVVVVMLLLLSSSHSE